MTALFFRIQDHVFFWDTIQLGAKHAWFYYETGFRQFILPEIDSGHPPLLGLVLAALWMLTGPSLAMSHWLMFPFVLGIGLFLFRLGDHFLGKKNGGVAVLLCLLDPVLAGQAILISPDLILVLGFLAGWYGVLKNKPGWKVFAALLLAATSTRGMMVVVVLFLVDVCNQWETLIPFSLNKMIRVLLPFIPSGLLALAFLAYHYQQTGWIGYHADSTWAPSFEKSGWSGFFKNLLVLSWRMLDFGRIFLWLPVLFFLFRKWPFWEKWEKKEKQVWAIFLVSTALLSITFLIYEGLHGHRYLLPVFIAFNFVFLTTVKNHVKERKWRNALYTFGLVALFSGNFWIYPDKIAQGWDSTLAHWPYYRLRSEILAFMEKERIPLKSVGTAFPEIGPLKYRDLSGDERGMVEKDLDQQELVLYSNVMNDFTDEEIAQLKAEWTIVEHLERNGVKIILYRNDNLTQRNTDQADFRY